MCIYLYIHVYTHIQMYVYTYIYIYIYLHMHIHSTTMIPARGLHTVLPTLLCCEITVWGIVALGWRRTAFCNTCPVSWGIFALLACTISAI